MQSINTDTKRQRQWTHTMNTTSMVYVVVARQCGMRQPRLAFASIHPLNTHPQRLHAATRAYIVQFSPRQIVARDGQLFVYTNFHDNSHTHTRHILATWINKLSTVTIATSDRAWTADGWSTKTALFIHTTLSKYQRQRQKLSIHSLSYQLNVNRIVRHSKSSAV